MSPQEDFSRERQEKRDAYTKLYNGVAANLPGWRVERNPDNDEAEYRLRLVNLAAPTQRIALELTGAGKHRGRVVVSGYWPRTPQSAFTSPRDVREDTPTITVDSGKPHEQIAKDIKRRFLPEYQRIFEKIEAKIAQDLLYESTKDANFNSLLAAGPSILKRGYGTQKAVLDIGEGWGGVEMESSSTVKIELRSIPIELALRLIATLDKAVSK